MSILADVIKEFGISEPPTPITDKTDKRASVSSVSEWSEGFETQPDDWGPHEIPAAIEAEQIKLARLRGKIPDCYTTETECKRCGLVPIWDGCPPEVDGCPWCFNRIQGLPIPQGIAV